MRDTEDRHPPAWELLRAYERGDPEARQQILERVEGISKTYASQEMGYGLRSLEESVDVAQSVILAFHLGAAAGKVDLPGDQALNAYVRGMVLNKLANRSDKRKTARRGGGRKPFSIEGTLGESLDLKTPDPSASAIAHVEETQRKIEAELSEDERVVFEGRLLGWTYHEIADQLGKSEDAVRMIWTRARERLIQLGVVDAPRRPR